ncbi:MAG: tetratricopeptide repeat protein [Deltaproteobacteria bacterium]|nr:tetratricopeptide repeat protein [Deltaproteobacteria bacterium]
MAAKLTKKELTQPDAFQSTIEVISDYISENKTRFYAIVAAVVLAAIIAFGIYIYWSNYQSSAKEMYARAQNDIAKNVETPEAARANIKIFQELIAKYPHSWSARMSHYHEGNLYYNLGEIDNAIAEYKKFEASRISDNAGIKFLGLTSLGYCYEAKKDFQSALEYFEKAQKSNNVGFESIGFRNIARIYEQLNDKKKALENYKSALEKTTDPSMTIFIKHKISSLS